MNSQPQPQPEATTREVLAGLVERVTYHNAENGFCVLRIKARGHRDQFADAAVQTIRLKLLKLGAQVRTSVRRIHFALASGCPNKVEFELAYLYLRRAFSSVLN